jgi:superfamily I DNA/RNA helicase
MGFKFNLPSRERINNSPNGKMMLRYIDEDHGERNLLITGCPGSGKTTVSIWRFIRLQKQQKPALLLTFQHMLRLSLENLAQQQGVPNESISTMHKWYYNKTGGWLSKVSAPQIQQSLLFKLGNTCSEYELIIDEGQDLPNKVFQTFPAFFKNVTIGADDAQRVHDHSADLRTIENALRVHGQVEKCFLEYNYRNSFEIYNFARQFVPNDEVAKNPNMLDRLRQSGLNTSEKPQVLIYSQNEKATVNAKLKTILANTSGNIAVLLGTAELVDEYARLIRNEFGMDASSYRNGLKPPTSLKNILVTTYVSAKGMEFDAVIMPFVRGSDKLEQLYVACTRAIRNLHLFVESSHEAVLAEFDKTTYNKVTEKPLELSIPAGLPF